MDFLCDSTQIFSSINSSNNHFCNLCITVDTNSGFIYLLRLVQDDSDVIILTQRSLQGKLVCYNFNRYFSDKGICFF